MTRIHCFTHVAWEPPARIDDWAAEHHYPLGVSRLYDGETPPPPDDYDWLVVMGGPMGVSDESTCPWLTTEMGAIEAAIGAGRTVVGICLGAQLIAHVMGARVYACPGKEIGWFSVSLTGAAEHHPLTEELPESFAAFHWHGDTFDLPSGAVHLARSEACAHQMYAVGSNDVAIQFHLEMTRDVIAALAENNAADLVDSPTISPREELAGDDTNVQTGYDILDSILARL